MDDALAGMEVNKALCKDRHQLGSSEEALNEVLHLRECYLEKTLGA